MWDLVMFGQQRGQMDPPSFPGKQILERLAIPLPMTIQANKSFTNPNFVNKSHPKSNNLLPDTYFSNHPRNGSHYDSSLTNNQYKYLENSSQSILDTVKGQPSKFLKKSELIVINKEATTEQPMYSRKVIKRNRENCDNEHRGGTCIQNNHQRLLQDFMEIDTESEHSMSLSEITESPKPPQVFALEDFVLPMLDDDNKECDTVDDSSFHIVDLSPTNAALPRIRERQVSIADSEDSFIVFKSGTDEELVFSDLSDSDEDTDSDIEDDFDSSSSVIPYKRVRFAEEGDLCEIHPMVQWSFAYQQARKGPWEEYARDRDRFNNRIRETGRILAPILAINHRAKIYQQRFDNDDEEESNFAQNAYSEDVICM